MNDTGSSQSSQSRHYAEAFSPMPGRCFRLIHRPGGEGQPMHCPEPPEWRGRFRAPNDRTYVVDACAGHAGPLIVRRPVARPRG